MRSKSRSTSQAIRHPMPPVADPRARWLILGSMPGVASLAAREYYAHPRNQFWDIMAAVFRIERSRPYLERLQELANHRVALWDTIASCRREGSLDAAIRSRSVRHHDIRELLTACPHIIAIGFNGAEAERQFRRSGQMNHPDWPQGIQLVRLPSTSPAMASMSLAQKIDRWHRFFDDAAF